MARPGLSGHRKFRRLARALGSRIVARGALELLWDSCYESGDDYVGSANDLESLVDWQGEPGVLTRALIEAGQPEGFGFIEPVTDRTDRDGQAFGYRIHDLWHHAPEYVSNRRARESERRIQKICARCDAQYHATDPRSEYCSSACRTAAWRERKDQRDGHVTEEGPANVRVTVRNGSHSPTHSPSPVHQKESAAPHGDAPPVLIFPTVGSGPRSWALTDAQVAEWQSLYPGIDVGSECRKALAWVKANQAKTARGMPAFLVNWFNRAMKYGGGRTARPAAQASMLRIAGCRHQPACTDAAHCTRKRAEERTVIPT